MTKILPIFFIFILTLPLFNMGYAFLYLSFIAFSYSILIFSKKRNTDFLSFFFLYFLILFTINFFFFQKELYELREFIIFIPLLYVFSILKVTNEKEILLRLILYYSLFIFIDFVFLYLFDNSEISKLIKQITFMPGMLNYTEYFWRHVGLLGNPNLSAMFYAIYIIFSINIVMEYHFNIVIKVGVLVAVAISLFLLALTFSRTGMIALIVSFFIMFFKNIKFSILIFIISGIFFTMNTDLIVDLNERFENLSSFHERLLLWGGQMAQLDWSTFLFGYPFSISVTDNDYLYFLLRFGFTGMMLMLFFPIYFLFKIKKRNFISAQIYLQLIIYSYITALAGGLLTSPKGYFFLVVFGHFTYNIYYNTYNLQHKK